MQIFYQILKDLYYLKVCAGLEEEGGNQEAYVKTLANETCKGETDFFYQHLFRRMQYYQITDNR